VSNLTVLPLAEKRGGERLLMVAFEESSLPEKEPERKKQGKVPAVDMRLEQIETELRYTRENLHATIEELQASNEELQSMNEEFQSTNEEFQSTNEELETSKEELQSVNEELVTVNSELQSKIEQLSVAENDMKNLLDYTNTIFLDSRMRIKRFTQAATKVINLIATDAGRPLADIVSRFENLNLPALAREVLDTLQFRELEARTRQGEWYLIRITPYRTADNVIDGLVVTFTDITGIRQTVGEKARRVLAEGIVSTVKQPLVVIDADMKVLSANKSFYAAFQTDALETEGRYFL
jgi:two-component system, chemotaxis family, CheB/CheR fusion protein